MSERYFINAIIDGVPKIISCGKAVHDKIVRAVLGEKPKTQEDYDKEEEELFAAINSDLQSPMNWDRITRHQPTTLPTKSGFRSILDDWEVTQDS